MFHTHITTQMASIKVNATEVYHSTTVTLACAIWAKAFESEQRKVTAAQFARPAWEWVRQQQRDAKTARWYLVDLTEQLLVKLGQMYRKRV